ncbi:MAG TPA: 3'(2'),5'-bisphosphate nucleotidase CysQ [Streptosporangiaceae bacterium]
MDDHELARDLAEQAGRRLVELRERGSDPDLLRKNGDRRSHEFLVVELGARRPRDFVLSEEAADNPARLAADRVWIVDPLDGTREFGETGRTDWAVHVALWERGAGLTAGAVALPAQDRVLSTLNPPAPVPGPPAPVPRPPATVPRPPAPVPRPNHEMSGLGENVGADGGADRTGVASLRVVVSRTRAPQFVRAMGVDVFPMGSAGAKAAAVLRGEADAYIHAGGFFEWDTAAPVAVARAAGFHASRIDGSALAYNQADLLMPDILVCRPALAGPLLQAIREVTHAH